MDVDSFKMAKAYPPSAGFKDIMQLRVLDSSSSQMAVEAAACTLRMAFGTM
jgi:hypothetical protein